MPTTNDLLGLRGVAERAIAYRFDLLDRDEILIGELHPDRDNTPTITHDTSRLIQRDMSNLNLTPVERLGVNTASDRVRPNLLLEDGSEFPLGVFLFADPTRTRHSYGLPLAATLLDKGIILDQPSEHSFSVPGNRDIRIEIQTLLAMFAISSTIENTGGRTGTAMTWPPNTTWARILSDLCLVGGYFPPFFDHVGVCRVTAKIDPGNVDPVVVYSAGANIYAVAPPVENDDLLRAPNRFVMVGTDATQTEVFGVYDLPAGAPNSFAARGFRITEVVTQQGLASPTAAALAARVYAESRSIFDYVTFSGPPDPRHDSNTVVEYLGQRWLELSWSLTLAPVGPHSHTLRKVYQS